MPKQVVYSVHQRSLSEPDIERELGMFTDDAMANQAIDHLYRYATSDIVKGDYDFLWFSIAVENQIHQLGRDRWITDNKHSDRPAFYKKPHDLWNQVPPSASAFGFSQETVDGGNVEVINSGRLF